MLLLLASVPALAQSVEVSASLDLTDGYAREGTYLPVRLRVANHTQEQITSIHLVSGGPVDVRSPLELAPAASEDIVLPVLFLGGTPTLALEFMSGKKIIARAAAGPLAVRKLSEDEALVAVAKGEPTLDDAGLKRLAELLGVKTVHPVELAPEMVSLVQRFGAVDAQVGGAVEVVGGRGVVVTRDAKGGFSLTGPRFPMGTETPVQPETFRLLATEVWPAAERLKLWLWLGLVALAVPAVGLLISRQRAVVATLLVLVVAGGATELIGVLGELSRERRTSACVHYARPGDARCASEGFALLESRGGATSHLSIDGDVGALPVPVLGSSADVFRPVGTLQLGRPGKFESRRNQVLLHTLRTEPAPKEGLPPLSAAAFMGMSQQWDRVALCVKGDVATDATGETRLLGGWVAAWKDSPDPFFAYAGRSLGWWAGQRQEGEGESVLVWGAAPVVNDASERTQWMPTLTVYQVPAAGK